LGVAEEVDNAEASEERRLMEGKAYRELDERKKKALFYATLALEEAFGVYRVCVERVRGGAWEGGGEEGGGRGPFKKVVYVADLGQLKQLAEKEEAAFENALRISQGEAERIRSQVRSERPLSTSRRTWRGRLAEAKKPELSEFGGVNFGTKAYAALIAYREYALGRRGAFGGGLVLA
jgi:hypothetical protein